MSHESKGHYANFRNWEGAFPMFGGICPPRRCLNEALPLDFLCTLMGRRDIYTLYMRDLNVAAGAPATDDHG